MKNCICVFFCSLFLSAGPVFADDFSFQFEWGDIPRCTSGRPNIVPNPEFVLSNVPAGTTFIHFTMKDLDVPTYSHGGGTVAYDGNETIKPGAFTYKSPCPPSGSHRYRWTAVAKEEKGSFGKSLGKAQATRRYP